MDDVSIYMLVVTAISMTLGMFVAYMAHRENEQEAADAAEDANRTAAE